MGRGRAKAKQAKIARELKYFSPPTDIAALQHELGRTARPDDGQPIAAGHHGEADEDSPS